MGVATKANNHPIDREALKIKELDKISLSEQGVMEIPESKHTPMMQQRVLSMKTALRFSKVTPKVTPLE
jgi:hypothetical protein